MTRMTRWAQGILCIGTLAGTGQILLAQPPVQFKANVRLHDGADGTTATGVMYFGGGKVRTEITMDGQTVVILADPATKSQVVLMPSDKIYMQMPIGQGPISVPVTGPTDPTNPCSGAGATDCVKGPMERVNGYETVRWDYTTRDGTRTRGWISTKLRFPIKTADDNDSQTEFTDIAEGPQPASLFAIPSGYAKMDVSAMGGMRGGSAGRGRAGAGARGNAVAGFGDLSPEVAAAMAAAMRGGARGPTGPTGVTGSPWESGKGWILKLSITGTASTNSSVENGARRQSSTYSAKYVASIPLNYGTPAIGRPGAPGPTWSLLASDGTGSPEALATPLTLSVETESKTEASWKGECGIAEEPGTSVTTMNGSAQKSVSIKQPSASMIARAVFKLSGDLKTYDLVAVVGGVKGKEVTQTRTETKGCRDGAIHSNNKSDSREVDYDISSIEVNGLPLPPSVSTITGSKKMPLQLAGHQVDANVTWTLAPIR